LRIKGLSTEGKQNLLALARLGIQTELTGRPLDSADYQTSLSNELWGCFVTLHEDGELRGCIGEIEPTAPLETLLVRMAQAAAFSDPRFEKVTERELEQIKIEISLLSSPEPVEGNNNEDKIAVLRPFVDGVILEVNQRRATFLPQVWDQLKDPSSFISALCQKAALPRDYWQTEDITLFTYQALHFEE